MLCKKDQKKDMKVRIRKTELFIYFGSILLILKTFLGASKIVICSETMDQTLALSGILCVLMSYVIRQKYSIREICIYIFLLSLTLINAIITRNNVLIITVVTCLAICRIDLKKYISFIFNIETVLLCVHTLLAIVLSLCGHIQIIQNIGGTERFDFGMQHPNMFAALVFNILIMYAWLNWNKLKIQHICTMMTVVIFLFIFCKTRTNFIAMIIIIALIGMAKGEIKCSAVLIEKIAVTLIPILSFFMWILVKEYSKKSTIILLLNKILNARILLGAYAYSRYDFSLLGQNMQALYTGTKWDEIWQLSAFTFDCVYSYMLINQGYIWLIILTVLFFRLAKEKNTEDNIMLIAWALYGMTEVQGLNCFSCFSLFLISKLVVNNKKSLAKKKIIYNESRSIVKLRAL